MMRVSIESVRRRSMLVINVNYLSSLIKHCSHFVPKHEIASDEDVALLTEFVYSSNKLTVLTGAGASTESGLPDYRSEEVGLYARSNHKPVQNQEFLNSEDRRKSYWARNFFGWEKFDAIKPNVVHKTLTEWEKIGKIDCIVTQNVDKLHQKSGAKNVIELHGSGYLVKCLNCSYKVERKTFQSTIGSLNTHLTDDFKQAEGDIRPDGDVTLKEELVQKFVVPKCPKCQGILKPDIVFFGDNVQKERVLKVYNQVEQTDALLVVGSSLHVYSGYRFVLHALEHNKKVAIISIGKSRADHLPSILFLRRRAGDILPRVCFDKLTRSSD